MDQFEMEYKLAVEDEAEYIYDTIKIDAIEKDYEADLFFEDVINRARQLIRKEE